jgi:hypothetical protein
MRDRGWCRFILFIGVAAIVPACGGGGGGGAPPAPVPDTIQFSSATYTADEGSATITITVTRTGGTPAASVNFATSNGTATAGSDYTAANGTLSWAAGESGPKTFDVPIAAVDAAVEGEETVTLTLSMNSGAPLGAQSTATLVITDPDSPPEGVFQFSAATYTVVEGTATVQATITVNRTGGGAGLAAVSVNVTDGSATTADGDYTAPTPNPFVLNWGDTEVGPKSMTIDVLDDGADGAGTETVNLALTAEVGGVIGSTLSTATLLIVDRDQAGTVQFSAASYSVFETGVSVTVTVTRAGGGGAASVDVNVTDGAVGTPATEGSDYTAPATNPVPLAWAEGDITDRTVTVAILDDATLEGDETIRATLQNVGGATIGAPATADITVVDDEPGTLVFTATNFGQPAEGNAATTTVTVSVTRTGGSLGPASVEVLVADGTATTADSDYVLPSPNPVVLNWGNGISGAQTFDITINGDTNVEPDETISLTLQNPTGAGLGAPTAATATITNDDVAASGNVQFAAGNVYTVLESAGSITINVSRVGGNAGTVTVNYATSNGTARSNGNPVNRDFVNTSGTLTWLGGDSTDKPIVIPINNNDTNPDAPSETFQLTLSNATGGAAIVGNNPETITITDD